MTLVVAELDRAGISLVADSRLVDPRSAHPRNLLAGALKLVIIDRRLCVGYAGVNSVAIEALRAVRASLGSQPDQEDVETLLASAAGGSVDFIVAGLSPPRLRSIRHGMVDEPAGGRAWIGNAAAFDDFQRAAADPEVSGDGADPDVVGRVRLFTAMQALINDAAHVGVGDVMVAVFPTSSGFTYSCSVTAQTGGEQVVPPGATATIEFGQGAPLGSFTQTVMTPPDGSGVGAIALYIREIGAGALFYPLRWPEPLVLRGDSNEQFREQVRLVSGVSVNGPFLN